MFIVLWSSTNSWPLLFELSVSRFVHISVHPSVSLSACSSLSRYNFVPLPSHSSLLSQHPLVADKRSAVCMLVCLSTTVFLWMSVYGRPNGIFGIATWRCQYKGMNILWFLCTVDFHYDILIKKFSFKIRYKLLNAWQEKSKWLRSLRFMINRDRRKKVTIWSWSFSDWGQPYHVWLLCFTVSHNTDTPNGQRRTGSRRGWNQLQDRVCLAIMFTIHTCIKTGCCPSVINTDLFEKVLRFLKKCITKIIAINAGRLLCEGEKHSAIKYLSETSSTCCIKPILTLWTPN